MGKVKASKHKQDLGKLKENDPEFHAFLEKNDKELLEFSASEDEFSSSEDEAEDISEVSEESEVEDDDHVEELEDDEEEMAQGPSEEELLERFIALKKQINEGSFVAARKFIREFKTLVGSGNEDEDEPGDAATYAMTEEKVSAEMMSIAVESIPRLFCERFDVTANGCDQEKLLKHRQLVKSWLNALLGLLKSVSDDLSTDFILSNLQKHHLAAFLVTFPRTALAKRWLSKLVAIWVKLPVVEKEEEEGEEENIAEYEIPVANVNSFLVLKGLVECKDNWSLTRVLKQAYKAFTQRSKRTNPTFLKHSQFLSNCMVELFRMSTSEAYQHGFVSIRYVALSLRKSITTHKTNSKKEDGVLSWETVNRLTFWCRALSDLSTDDEELKKLIYPLTQTIFCLLSLAKGVQWYPFVLHLLNGLHQLSNSTRTYIPLAPKMFELLKELTKQQKIKPATVTHFNWDTNVKISGSFLHTRALVDDALLQTFNLLVKHLSCWSNDVSFPEISVSIVVKLKSILKQNKNPKFSALAKGLIEKISSNNTSMLKKRKDAGFAPCHIYKIMKFSEDIDNTPLQEYMKSNEKVEKQMKALLKN